MSLKVKLLKMRYFGFVVSLSVHDGTTKLTDHKTTNLTILKLLNFSHLHKFEEVAPPFSCIVRFFGTKLA
jgi:hypothetical protein